MKTKKDGGKMPCLIPARGGSKGVPRKNIRMLAGKPLIVHSIEFALSCGCFEGVYVSSEDDEILKISKNAGAIAVKRPPELALDSTPMPPVVDHWLGVYEKENGKLPEMFCLLMPTTPFRKKEDIRECVRLLKDDAQCESSLVVFESDEPPFWTMVDGGDGYLKPLYPNEYFWRRQDLKKAYFDGPAYVIRTSAYKKYQKFLTPHTRYVLAKGEFAIDIDTELDFMLAEFWAEEKKKNKQ